MHAFDEIIPRIEFDLDGWKGKNSKGEKCRKSLQQKQVQCKLRR